MTPNIANSTYYAFKCPCCDTLFYENMRSIDEAILIGEAVLSVLMSHLIYYYRRLR